MSTVRCDTPIAPYRWNVERRVRILLHDIAKAAHHHRVLPLRQTVLTTLTLGEAVDHRFDPRLLKAAHRDEQ